MTREILEEVWLIVTPEDLKLVNITHRINTERVSIDFYYEILHYSGAPKNAEPEKSEGIYWIDWKNEKQLQFKQTLEKIELWEMYSEIDFRKYGY